MKSVQMRNDPSSKGKKLFAIATHNIPPLPDFLGAQGRGLVVAYAADNNKDLLHVFYR